ncbi:PKD-like family lipoprotein [Marinifilum sp. D714]|uniref:PKD-like family lipoprotein n=1 Tax=Marinifilum sp. D714 TaxID=2937523 RepID=UPI0027CEEB85|nr:PKD-like family lipoprotein [Marinifilum sp. D714]MDQ2177170.1 PKD-like family lipoprotein [Marinifilum sp. D714]
MAILVYSCSEDLGNYDYKDLNNISVSDIPADTSIQVLSRLVLEPIIERDLVEDEKALEFVWRLGNDTISTERNLDYIIPTSTQFGTNDCFFTVLDKNTGVRYYFDFKLNVTSAFGFGYYVLSEKQDQSSLISYLRTDYEEYPEWTKTNMIGNIEIGNKASQMSKKFSYQSSFRDYGWTFNILTKEGEYPLIETNSFSFLPTSLANKDSYVGGANGKEFAPKALVTGNSVIYFQTGDGYAPYASGLLNPPASFGQDYEWTLSGLWQMGQSSDVLWGYDKISNKLYTITYTKSDPINGIVGNPYLYDNVQEIEGLPSLDGYSVMNMLRNSSYNADYTSKTENLDVVVYNNSGITIHNKKTVQELEWYQPKGDPVITNSSTALPVSGLNDESVCQLVGTNFYFIIGNSIYTSPSLNPKLTKIVDIPAEFGKPLKFEMSIKGSKLWVATYDESSTEELKGSVIVVDPANKTIDNTFKNVCGKPAQMLTADGNPWW